MAKNKPQYKIDEEVYTKAQDKMARGMIKEIYIGRDDYCYVVKTYMELTTETFNQVVLEGDVYKTA